MMIKLTVDGRKLKAQEGMTLLDICRQNGIKIPTLCYHEAVTPYGACRLCLVEVTAGPRTVLAASCMYPATDGVKVKTSSERVLTARRMVAELLLARCPGVPKVQAVAAELGVKETRFTKQTETCVLCGLCVRGCREIAGVGALDFAGRGAFTEVVTPFGLPSEICVGCSTCVYLCPTDTVNLAEVRQRKSPHPQKVGAAGIKCTICGPRQAEGQFRDVEEPLT